MSFAERFIEGAFRLAGAKVQTRSYAAAKNNRLVGDWTTTNLHANQEIKQSLRVLRARARQLSRDDDYFIGFLRELESNVIGAYGIRLQVNAKDENGVKLKNLNKAVEDDFKMWMRKVNCTVTAQDTFRDAQALALRTLAVEGEFLIRLIFDKSSPYGLKLQFLDVDWLDEDYNDPQYKNGNRIVMSIELDQFDKPVAYWLTNPKWNNLGVPGTKVVPRDSDRLRVPAEQIIHRFVRERVGQNRGVTWAHGAMMRLNMLGGYEEAELVGARVAASQMAFVSKNSDETQLTNTNGVSDAQIDTEVSPGQIMELPAGYSVHEFSPKRPGNNYQVYTKAILRAIAKSLGVSYNTLTSDLESTSYSSIRAGTISERDMWKLIQMWFATHFCQDIYEKWLIFNSQIVPVAKLVDVMFPVWQCRGFDWVDPSKDTRADIEAMDRGLKTHSEILAEKGKDFEETMEQIAYERQVIKDLDLEFNSPNYPIPSEIEQEAAKQAKNVESDDSEE